MLWLPPAMILPLVGARALLPGTRVRGVDIEGEPERLRRQVSSLAGEICERCRIPAPSEEEVVVLDGAGPGYRMSSNSMVSALREIAHLEGLLLDPVYSGKAMASFLELLRSPERCRSVSRGKPLAFVHTGGTPALFAYRSAVAKQVQER